MHRGGQQNTTCKALLLRCLVATLSESHVPHEVGSKPPFKPRGGVEPGHGSFLMDAFARAGALFPDKQDLASYSFAFCVPVTSPLKVCRLDAARLRPGHAIEQAVKGKEGTFYT